MSRGLIPLTDPSEVPEGMSEAEARAFWDTHEVTEAYLAKSEPDDDGPPKRDRPKVQTRATSLRLERNTTERLQRLADKKGLAYQTLLKQFVVERLYEEEKREGFLD